MGPAPMCGMLCSRKMNNTCTSAGCADTVVRAMNDCNGKCYFRGLTAPKPFDGFSKNFAQFITSTTPPHMQMLRSVGQRGRVCACVKLSPSGVYFLLFFKVSCASLQVRPLDRSTPLTAQTTHPVGIHIPYMVWIIKINIFLIFYPKI